MLLRNIEDFNDFLDSLAIYSSNNLMQPEILSRKMKKSIENHLSKNPFHENETCKDAKYLKISSMKTNSKENQ